MGLGAAFKRHSNGKKAFKQAAEGNFKGAMDLIDQGGDVNYRAIWSYVSSGAFPMWGRTNCDIGFMALERNNMQALAGFLERGLDPNSVAAKASNKKDVCFSLLEYAIDAGNQQAIDLLVKAGASTAGKLKDMKTTQQRAKEQHVTLTSV